MRHQIASEIKTISCRLQNVVANQQKYRDMYAIMDQGASSTYPATEEFDGRGDALFLEEDDVVGIEKPKEQLLEWIRSMDSGVNVISVVGMGGLGKTTLVKKVYDKESIKTKFDIHVWVVVSDYRDVKHLLQNVIKKLTEDMKESSPQGLHDMSIDDMRYFLYGFLKKKKYIIVLDGVWKSSTWDALKYALPRKGGHGCIIITTRSNSISQAACSETNYVYHLKPLSQKESQVLFFKKAFPRKSHPPSYLLEFALNILKRCEGLPLAIVVIGGALATKKNQAIEWELFNRNLSHELDGGILNRLGKLISLSYNDLPYYLKYCYLYLSIFPECGLMEKDRIIRLWIAEGYVLVELPQGIEHLTNLKYVYFYDMPNKLTKVIIEEKRRQGDSWRLARVPKVYYATMRDNRSLNFNRI